MLRTKGKSFDRLRTNGLISFFRVLEGFSDQLPRQKTKNTLKYRYRILLNYSLFTESDAIYMSNKSRKSNIEVHVNSNVEKALRQLKKKIEREGIVRDMKRTVYFESPTQKRRKRLVRAIKQNLIRLASQNS
jgi:ribosomal protein S21